MLGLTEKEDVGAYYFPNSQDAIRGMTVIVRSAMEPDALASSVRRQVTALDPELPFYAVQSMTGRIDESLLNRRTPMLLAILFAGIALFLASVGIYGVLAYQVSQRRREIGIRLALGSDGSRIFQLVVREGLVLLAAGVAGGLVGAFSSVVPWSRSCSGSRRWIPRCSARWRASWRLSRSSRVPSRPAAPRGSIRSSRSATET